MDHLRARVELSCALPIGAVTTLAANARVQVAHYPRGNLFGGVLVVDDDELQNSLALQATRRINDSLALTAKFQAFANELSSQDGVYFRRQVAQAGARWSF